MRWTLAEVADALGVAVPPGADSVARLAGVSIDSRTVKPGELFVAIRGPRHDGHNFVATALAQGALAGIVARDRLGEYTEEIRGKLLVVDDTLRSLQELAQRYCDAWRAAKPGRRMAAVTGSAGKTTTKEILAALLAARFRVLKSEGNLNNEYGLPLTLFRLGDEHDAAVVELGMSHRGELARLAEISRPDVGVVTNVAPVHLEFFSSIDEIALAKRELIEGLGGAEPVAVLNADDARVSRFAEGFRGRVLRFGLSDSAEFRAENIEDRGVEGSGFDYESPEELGRLRLPLAWAAQRFERARGSGGGERMGNRRRRGQGSVAEAAARIDARRVLEICLGVSGDQRLLQLESGRAGAHDRRPVLDPGLQPADSRRRRVARNRADFA